MIKIECKECGNAHTIEQINKINGKFVPCQNCGHIMQERKQRPDGTY